MTNKLLIECFNEFIELKHSLIGIENKAGTVKNYRTTRKNLVLFLTGKELLHLQCKDFSPDLAREFEIFMKRDAGIKCGQGHINNMLKKLRTVLDYAAEKGYCLNNPIKYIKLRKEPGKRIIYLSTKQLQRFCTYSFRCNRLQA